MILPILHSERGKIKDSEKTSVCHMLMKKEGHIGRAQKIFKAAKILYDIIMVDICCFHLSKSIECTPQRVTLNINYIFWQ